MPENNNYSLKKSDISREKFDELMKADDALDAITKNLENAFSADIVKNGDGIFGIEDFVHKFTFDGAVRTSIDPANGHYAQFFKKKGRRSKKGSDFILRGSRYLISVDPTLEVRQKLEILSTDFIDAIDVLSLDGATISKEDFIEQSAILDYIKNTTITLFNSFIQQEKIGKFQLDDAQYQNLRKISYNLAKSASIAYYSQFIGRADDYTVALTALVEDYERLNDITEYIESKYREGIFSSRYFTRPEAGHPLIIASSVYTAVNNIANTPDTVIGLPSGGTELAFAQQYAYRVLSSIEPDLVLVPLSLHSIKDAFGAEEVDTSSFLQYLNTHRDALDDRGVLIIEDNSSTGRTIQMLVDMLRAETNTKDISVSVAEADVIRSQINSEAQHRTHVAGAKVYQHSVHILPISRIMKPKVDMKEIAEKKRIAHKYRMKLKEARTPQEELMYRAYVQMCTNPTQEILRDLTEDNAILEFRHTFLSNFYTVPVVYNGVEYPSVEHAYQAQKFTPEILGTVNDNPKHLEQINETLHLRGQPRTFKDARNMFTDKAMSSGNVKIIADILRDHGYVRDGWDDDKVLLMATLLKEKFKDVKMRDELLATTGKYLVEGNTWDDTLWGVSGGRGRNLLGLMLMDVRGQLQETVAV